MNRTTTTTTAALVGCALALTACSSGGHAGSAPRAQATHAAAPAPRATAVDAGLGPVPSYLPASGGSRLAHGSLQKPALSFPGSPVVVDSPAGSVTMDVDGPETPPDTKVGAERVVCTYTLTISDATRPISLKGAHLDVYDNAGTTHALAPVDPMPTQVLPGQHLTVRLRATLPSGEGLVRYYPGGSIAPAAWDYVAETD